MRYTGWCTRAPQERQLVSDAWFADECRQQRRCVRWRERRFKRAHHDVDRAFWLVALGSIDEHTEGHLAQSVRVWSHRERVTEAKCVKCGDD